MMSATALRTHLISLAENNDIDSLDALEILGFTIEDPLSTALIRMRVSALNKVRPTTDMPNPGAITIGKNHVARASQILLFTTKRLWKRNDPLLANQELNDWILRTTGNPDIYEMQSLKSHITIYKDIIFGAISTFPVNSLSLKDLFNIMSDFPSWITMMQTIECTKVCKEWAREKLLINSPKVFEEILKMCDSESFDHSKFIKFFTVYALREVIPEETLIDECTKEVPSHRMVVCIRTVLNKLYQNTCSLCELNTIWNTSICSFLDPEMVAILRAYPGLESVFCARNVLVTCIWYYQLWTLGNAITPRSTSRWMLGLQRVVAKWIRSSGHGKTEIRILELKPFHEISFSIEKLEDIKIWGHDMEIHLPKFSDMSMTQTTVNGFSKSTISPTLVPSKLDKLVMDALSCDRVRGKNQFCPITFHHPLTETRNLHSIYTGFSPLVLPQTLPIPEEEQRINRISDALFTIQMRHLFPDPQAYFVALLLLATLLQYSEKKTDLFCILDGPQGSGKSAWLGRVQMMMGEDKSTHITQNQLEKFNALSENKRMLIIEEIGKLPSKVWNRVKTMITETKVVLEKKGIDATVSRNDFTFFGTNNPREGDNSMLKSSINGRRAFFSEHKQMPLDEMCGEIKDPEWVAEWRQYRDFNAMFNAIIPLESYDISPSTIHRYKPVSAIARKLGTINVPESVRANEIVLLNPGEHPTDNFNLQLCLPVTAAKFIAVLLDNCPPCDKSWKGPFALWGLVMLQYDPFTRIAETYPRFCSGDDYGFTDTELHYNLNSSIEMMKDLGIMQAIQCSERLRTLLENPKSKKQSVTLFADNMGLQNLFEKYFAPFGNAAVYQPQLLNNDGRSIDKCPVVIFNKTNLKAFLNPLCNYQLEEYLNTKLYDHEEAEAVQLQAMTRYLKEGTQMPSLFDEYPTRNRFLIRTGAKISSSQSSQSLQEPVVRKFSEESVSSGKRLRSPEEDDIDLVS